jgi:hypothetical protein
MSKQKQQRKGDHGLGPYKLAAMLCTLLLAAPVSASIYESDTVKFYGDFRTRAESDFDSKRADGTSRDDRSRLRIRARLGVTYTPDKIWEYGMRLRSGSDDSQQSPHITILDFDDNDTGDAGFNFDKWYLKGKTNAGSYWVGRNSLPYWKQNELFWDDDVTPAGVGGTYKRALNDTSKLEVNAGYFSLPAGMKAFTGEMGTAQVVYHADVFTVAGGLLSIKANPNDPDNVLLLSGNGARDYNTWIVSGQVRFKVGEKPLTIGADIMSNTKSYSSTDPDPDTANNFDQTDGYDIFAVWGSTKPQQWLLGYYYANIEALAVNSSYAQDDWVRWGSATQTRATDIKGSEFRAAYGLSKTQNLVARLYLVESITTVEDGNRLRLDWNVKF